MRRWLVGWALFIGGCLDKNPAFIDTMPAGAPPATDSGATSQPTTGMTGMTGMTGPLHAAHRAPPYSPSRPNSHFKTLKRAGTAVKDLITKQYIPVVECSTSMFLGLMSGDLLLVTLNSNYSE